MSEAGPGAALAAPQFGDGVTAGMLLRQARQAAGLHVAALAVSLKVPVRKLEALEEDRFDLLPDAVFVRALASSVCRTLKIDPQPVLERMPQTATPRLIQDRDGINAPFRTPSDGAGPSWFDQLSKPVVLAVFALLLGALILIFLPTVERDDAAAAAKPETGAAPLPVIIPGSAVEPVVPQLVAALRLAQPTPGANVVVAPTLNRAAPAALAPTLSIPAVVSPTAVPTPSPALARAVAETNPGAGTAPMVVAPPANGVVVFRATGPSWVQVTDASGVVALRRLLAAGETAGASGSLPLAVTIGSASATEVKVRDRPFDLAPVSRDNVARFEVK